MNKKSAFTQKLLLWNKKYNQRHMPWKGEKDPYKIWLSEIILQQTRVQQGWKYYENFIQNFPAIQDLALAKDEKVFKLWEGLGYYNRCKNLLQTAREITFERKGVFPETYDEIIKLKGVGPYTAAAIASFAFDLPHAVVDGNVFRVLSRVYGIDKPIDSSEGKAFFTTLAQENIDNRNPGAYNQAIMDFGATVCKPVNPECASCLMKTFCIAHSNGLVNHLPIKESIIHKKIRHLTWLKINADYETLVYLRTAKDIWQNLHEFYLIEKAEKTGWTEKLVAGFCKNIFGTLPQNIFINPQTEQQLTHQKIKAQIIEINFKQKPETLLHQQWISQNKLQNLAFPKLLAQYLQKQQMP